jgi:hypothetical protein
VPGSGASIGDDAMTLLPVTNLGTLYYPDTYHGAAEFAVVAVEDGTTVTWENPHCPGLTTVVLDRGEAVQHECPDVPANADQRGIEGTRLESDRPVAVFTGSTSNIISYYFGGPRPLHIYWCCADILLEQMRPVSDWEFEYRTVPGVATGPLWRGDLVRITAGCDGTDVTVEDGAEVRQARMDAGDVWDLVEADFAQQTFSLADSPLVIRSDQPVQVSQYTVGFMNAGMGDPSHLVVPGLSRAGGTYPFLVLEEYESYVNVVAPSAAASQVFLDGAPVDPGAWTAYPDGAWLWARLSGLDPGPHALVSPAPLAVSVLGYSLDPHQRWAGAISYPVPSGGVDDPFPSLVTSDPPCGLHCPGDCIRLDGGGGYASWEWSTGETTREIVVCPTGSATYTVRVLDASGCEGQGRIQVPVLPAPEPVISGALEVCEGQCTDLSVGGGYASVLWSTGESGPSIRYCPTDPVSEVGVTVVDGEGCSGEASVTVTAFLYPDFEAARAADEDPCTHGVRLDWDPAVWRSSPPSGTYAVHRSETDCAEALAAAGRGLSTAVCIEPPVVDVLDREPPAPGAGASLRGAGHAPSTAVFSWEAAPSPDPAEGEHYHLYRSADLLGPFERVTPEGFAGRGFTDGAAGGARLLFYDLRMADGCENVEGDPYPPTPREPGECHEPVLTEGLPLAWDTFAPPCGSLRDAHTCTPLDMRGNDRAHLVETLAAGPFAARLTNGGARLDLLLYDEAVGTCLGWGDEEIGLADLPAGRYRLLVDGPPGSEGPYGVVFASGR